MSHFEEVDIQTLPEMIFRNEYLYRDKLACDFWGAGKCIDSLTFGEIAAAARGAAMRFNEVGVRGKRVLLLHPPGLDFLVDFLGCLIAGGIAVPMPPPDRPSDRKRLGSTFSTIAPALVVVGTDSVLKNLHLCDVALSDVPMMQSVRSFSDNYVDVGAAPDDLAVIQFTSGSSETPKGSPLSHKAILFNLEQISAAFDFRVHERHESVVLWLPHYHDMGLFGRLECLFAGCPCHLFSHMEFVRRPSQWMRLVSSLGATVTGAPNFAFELAADAAHSTSLDLSSLRVAFCGAEPIVRETLDRFRDSHRSSGLNPTCITPCYGMAEATLMVSCHTPGNETKVLTAGLDLKSDVVSCGKICPGTDLVIVHSGTGEPIEHGSIGEICIKGPNVINSYHAVSDSKKVDGNFLTLKFSGCDQRFFRTGDLGFVIENELYVVGRTKSVIIINGQNYHPHDLERSIESSHALLRSARAVVLPLHGKFGESCAAVIEVPARVEKQASAFPEIFSSVLKTLRDYHDIDPTRIIIVRRGGIIWTTSGKIARTETRLAFNEGNYHAIAEWPALNVVQSSEDLIVTRVTQITTAILGRTAEMSLSLPAQGGDSLTALRIGVELHKSYGDFVSDSDLVSSRSLSVIAADIDRRLIDFVNAMPEPRIREALQAIELQQQRES